MKTRILLTLFLMLLKISTLQAQTATPDTVLYVGQEWKMTTINMANYYQISDVVFVVNEPMYSSCLNLEIREFNSERDFVVTPIQYFTGIVSVTVAIYGKRTAENVDNRELLCRTYTISCKDNPLHIDPTEMTLRLGGQKGMIDYWSEERAYESAAIVTFQPESNIVSVASDGKVTALKPGGPTRIRVHSNLAEEDRFCVVTVMGNTQPEGITLDVDNLTMTTNTQDTLIAIVSPNGVEFSDIDWSVSDNDGVVTVRRIDKTRAVVTAKKQGTATVVATIQGSNLSASCQVKVTAAPVAPTAIKLNKNSLTLSVEEQDTLKAIITPEDAEYTIDWTVTGNAGVVIVKRLGKATAIVSAVGKGSTTVTAAIRGTSLKSVCQVAVSSLAPERIKLNQHSLAIQVGDGQTLVATVTPEDAEYGIQWKSSNEEVATVKRRSDTRFADVTAKGTGVATIMATVEGTSLKDSCKVNVTITPTEIAMPHYQYEMIVGDEIDIRPIVGPTGAEYILAWDSNDPDVVTVEPTDMTGKTGRLNAINEGEAMITATIVGTGIYQSCKVIVRKPKLTVTATPKGGIVNKGAKVMLVANSSDAKIYYTTDGTTPDQFDQLYYTPIPIYQDCKIKAIAIQEGYNNSDVLTVSFKIRTTPGDVNKDSETNVADVNSIINVILGGTDSETMQWADINNDSEVNIADVNAVVDIILNPRKYIQDIETFVANGVEFNMVYVDGGTFIMGKESDPDDDWDSDRYEYLESQPAHRVTVSSFKMGETEVTQELWTAVMGSNPSSHVGPGTKHYPVENVSWYDCQEFIKRLNGITGKNFRLPLEAEWEFAARGGNKSSGKTYVTGGGWYWAAHPDDTNSQNTTKVGQFSNELGLCDMAGNVSEWCFDWYSSYNDESLVNPIGPSTGIEKVLRGSSCILEDWPVYDRVSSAPNESDGLVGFRLVLSDVEAYSVNDVSFAMIHVGGGTFTMGATLEQEGEAEELEYPAHKITVPSFSIGQTVVTLALWNAVNGCYSNPEIIECPYSFENFVSPSGLIIDPKWDVYSFIGALNSITGKSFRLPYEAEWEFAARGGNMSRGYKYAGSDNLEEVAWFDANSSGYVHPVCTKAPNELGLYDMSGNVLELCEDEFKNYQGGYDFGRYPFDVRGGSWYNSSSDCRVSARNYGLGIGNVWENTIGFRLALGDSEDCPLLKLDWYGTKINVGNTTSIDIIYGSGSYECNSSNNTVAKCWIEGNKVLMKGNSVGSAIITVTDLMTNAIATINVNVIVLPTSIKLDKTSLNLQKGESKTLTATVMPSNADYSLYWTKYSSAITIEPTGENTAKVTAVSEGSAKIIVGIEGTNLKAECNVTVVADDAQISLEKSDTIIAVNNICEVAILNGSGDYSCTSSDLSVASWSIANSKTLIIRGHKAGTATVTITDNKSNARATITVKVFGMSKTTATIGVGGQVVVDIINGGGNYSISYPSSLISFKRDGNRITFTGKSAGTANVTVTDVETKLKATIMITITSTAQTPMPVIEYEIDNEAVAITAYGEGEVKLYVEGDLVENPCFIVRPHQDVTIVVTATAQNEGEIISEVATMEITIPGAVEPDNPHSDGYWVVFVDKDGNNAWYFMVPEEDLLFYSTMLYLKESDFGMGDVRFFFCIDGVTYGPSIDGTGVVLGDASQNPLMANGNCWVLPSGYIYLIGVVTDPVTEKKYVMCSTGGFTLGSE